MTKQRKALESALIALAPMEKLFRQVEAATDGPMPISVDCVIKMDDLRTALYSIGEIRGVIIDDAHESLTDIAGKDRSPKHRIDELQYAVPQHGKLVKDLNILLHNKS